MRVLILEDDLKLQKAVKTWVERAFDDVDVYFDLVNSAPKAIGLLQHFNYDFMVSDYEVIGGTGGDVLDYLRQNKPDMVGRFVFFSGTGGLNKHHDQVIEKGIFFDDFAAQLKGFLVGKLS